jgi:hypothetical protein
VSVDPRRDARRLGFADPAQTPVPPRPTAVDVGAQVAQRQQPARLQRRRQQRIEPISHAVAGSWRLSRVLFDPPERLELAGDEPRPSALALAGAAVLGLIKRYLLGLGEVLQAPLFDEFLKRRQRRRAIGHAGGIQQDEAGRAEARFPSGRCGEFVPQPRDGGPHGAGIAALFFPAQVAVPGRLQLHPLDDRPHEGEMAVVQLAALGPGGPRRGGLGRRRRREQVATDGRLAEMSGNLSAHVAFSWVRALNNGISAG